MKSRKKAQSTIEFIVLFTGVIVFVLFFLAPQGIFHKSLEKTYTDSTDALSNMSGNLHKMMVGD